MNRTRTLLSTAFLLSAVLANAQTNAVNDIAELFFPATMASLPGVAEDRHWSAVEADLDRSGKPDYIVAVYSNGTVSRIRVIRRTLAGPALAADPLYPDLGDQYPRMEVIDVDADGRPEISVSMDVGRGNRQVWIFKWTENRLKCINPSPSDPRDPEDKGGLVEGGLVDVDGDGRLEFIEPADTFGVGADSEFMDESWLLYTLNNGEFRDAGLVPYHGAYFRSTRKPSPKRGGFTAEAGDYTLRLATGEGGTPVVDSAVIKLNGTIIASPSVFKGKTRHIDVPVTLKTQNTIEVEVRGKPGSKLNVTIVRPR